LGALIRVIVPRQVRIRLLARLPPATAARPALRRLLSGRSPVPGGIGEFRLLREVSRSSRPTPQPRILRAQLSRITA
jgi:hypothetical protein